MSRQGTNMISRERQLYGRSYSLRAQELRMDEGLPHGTGDQGLDEEVIISNPAADLSGRPQQVLGDDSVPPLVAANGTQQQQQRPSATTVQLFPPVVAAAGGELVQAPNPGQPRPLNIPPSALHHPEPHFPMRNVEMLPHYGGIFPFTPPTTQRVVTSLGLPASNLPVPPRRASSSSFQLTPAIYPRNPLGTETYAPIPRFPMIPRANNPNLQQLNSQLSACNLRATLDQMMLPRGFSGFFPTPRAPHDMMAFYPIRDPDVMRDPSSRNVRMRMTLPSINEQSLELQLGILPDPSAQGNTENPDPSIRHVSNLIYHPIYEAMGFPVDPHLRAFLTTCSPTELGSDDDDDDDNDDEQDSP